MKYFFGTVALAALLFSAPMAHAQASCGTISSGNYDSCCASVDLNSQTGKDCTAFYYANRATATGGSCTSITAANYNSCCSTVDNSTQQGMNCTAFFYSSGMATVSNQVGGSQSVSPVNGSNSSLATVPSVYSSTQAGTACSAIKFKTILDIAIWIKCIIGAVVVPGIFTLAFVVFLWGVFKFIRSSEQKDKQESKQFIYMGLIGLFVMTSVWGIIKIFATTLGIETVVPTLQTTSLDIKNASK